MVVPPNSFLLKQEQKPDRIATLTNTFRVDNTETKVTVMKFEALRKFTVSFEVVGCHTINHQITVAFDEIENFDRLTFDKVVMILCERVKRSHSAAYRKSLNR